MKINKYIVIVFLLSLAIVSVATYYSISNSKRTELLANQAFNSEHQIARIERMYAITSTADEGVMNCIITGNEKYLVPSDSSVAKINRIVKNLQKDLGDDTDLLEDATILANHIYVKLHFIDTLAKVRKLSFDSAQKMVSSKDGIALMDTIRTLVANINKREREERTGFTQQGELYNSKTNFTIILGELIAFLIIFFVLFKLNGDMKKRIESEKQVSESEIRYRTIAQNVGSFIYTCDYYGKITFATPNISKLTGYTPEEITGKHFTFLVAADYVESIKNGYYTQFKNKIKEQTSEFELVTRTGLRKKVKQDVVIFSTEDMMMGFQCTIHDLSEPATI